MEDLIDIQGLDAISWWPLALGWWIVIGITITLMIASIIYFWKRYKYRNSWQYVAHRRLEHMYTQLHTVAPKKTLQDLSIELRKIAIKSTQRSSCASLVGRQWLQWLEEHDPAGYNWLHNGTLLIDAQYMPETSVKDLDQVAALILAAQGWVNKC